MKSEIEEIKSRLDIVDVLSSYIKLEKAGINYRACCPFHKEKTPSFFVSPSRQLWHCFGGCNEGGDIFQFVMKIENIEFAEALKILAQRAGVELRHIDSKQAQKEKTEKEKCSIVCELAAKFFELYLEKTSVGQKVKKYLFDRGLTEETIHEWRIGYAPSSWSKLSEFLIGRGYERKDLVASGVSIEKEGNKFFDRFRSRIMFPICDIRGGVAGFTGRVFGDNENDMAKYLNTPNTLLYDKSKIIFGLDKAKTAIKENDFCVLVEGNMDCIASHQAGIKNCVAVSGTALTEFHLNILKRYTQKLVLSFDMDTAGNNATKRGIRMAQNMDFDIKVIPMFGEKDPADIVLYEGAEKWKELVSLSKPINQFYFETALKDRDLEKVEDKKKIASEFLPIIKEMNSNIDQAYWIGQLSQVLKIDEGDIREELKNVKVSSVNVASNDTFDKEYSKKQFLKFDKKSRKELVDEEIAILILINPEKIDLMAEDLINSFSSPIKDVLLKIKQKKDIKTEELIQIFKDDAKVMNYITYLIMKAETRREDEDELEGELQHCLVQRQILDNKLGRNKLSIEIKELEKKGDFEKIKILLEEFKKLSYNKNEEANQESTESKN
ncbi:MAG: DNA primase [Candidatus Pacebacteria bacterium]|nr:DNA primase [Candidatus Paceibacterota bacterium]